jgi:hypothetical protein
MAMSAHQYALSDSILEQLVCPLSEIYSLIFSKPLNTPSTAKTEGALIECSSPQQLSSNFLILYSTNSMPDLLKRSTALIESCESSTSKMGLRPTIIVQSNTIET